MLDLNYTLRFLRRIRAKFYSVQMKNWASAFKSSTFFQLKTESLKRVVKQAKMMAWSRIALKKVHIIAIPDR